MYKFLVDKFSRSCPYVRDYHSESDVFLGNAIEDREEEVNDRESASVYYNENGSIIPNIICSEEGGDGDIGSEEGGCSLEGYEFHMHESLRLLERITNLTEEASSCSSGEEEEVVRYDRDYCSRKKTSRCQEDFFKGHYSDTLVPAVIRYNNEISCPEEGIKFVRIDDKEEVRSALEGEGVFGGLDKTLRNVKITPEDRKARNLCGRENTGMSLSKQAERSDEDFSEWISGQYSRPSQCEIQNGGAGDLERVSDERGSVDGRFHWRTRERMNAVEGIDHVFECGYEKRAENMINRRCDKNSTGERVIDTNRSEGENGYDYREWGIELENGIECAGNYEEGNNRNVDEYLENLGKQNELRSEVSYSELGNELDFSYRMSMVCLKLLRKKAQLERELAEFMASLSNLVINDNLQDLETNEDELSQEKYSILKIKKLNPFSVIHARYHNKSILENLSRRYDYIGNKIFENATDLEAHSNEYIFGSKSRMLADTQSEDFSDVNPCFDDGEYRQTEENDGVIPVSEYWINEFADGALDYHFRAIYDASDSASIYCDKESFTWHKAEFYEADNESVLFDDFQLENIYFSEMSPSSSQIQIDNIVHNVSSFDSRIFNIDFTDELHNPEGEFYGVIKTPLQSSTFSNPSLERLSDIDVTMSEGCLNSGHVQYCPDYRDYECILDKELLNHSKNYFSHDNKRSSVSVVHAEYEQNIFNNLEKIASSPVVRNIPVDLGETSAMTNRDKNSLDRSFSTDLGNCNRGDEELNDVGEGVVYPNNMHYEQYGEKSKRMPYLRMNADHSRDVPVSTNCKGIKCPVCSKFVLPDDIECHLVMCLTKPRLSYNEDILGENKGECVICLEDLLQGDIIARLPCLCIYHKGCIDRWFEVNRSCPEHPGD